MTKLGKKKRKTTIKSSYALIFQFFSTNKNSYYLFDNNFLNDGFSIPIHHCKIDS
jgi:hypothetical protein